MPVYALLGATGSTGSAIVRCLLSEPPKDLTLNILVRSRVKLLAAFPGIESTDAAFRCNVFEGTPQDATTLRDCLNNADVIFNCIGANTPTVDTTLITDTATAVVDALKSLRDSDGGNAKRRGLPTVVQLRSSTLNPEQPLGWFSHSMAWFCFYYVYVDLDRACKLFASHADLLDVIFIDPPSIHDAEGTKRTGHKVFVDVKEGKQEPVISYADLGAAFCEVAERRAEFAGKGVLVTAAGEVRQTWGPLVGYMWQGFLTRVWG